MEPTRGSAVSLRQGISLKFGLLTWQGYVRERNRAEKEHQKSLEESHLVISQMISCTCTGEDFTKPDNERCLGSYDFIRALAVTERQGSSEEQE